MTSIAGFRVFSPVKRNVRSNSDDRDERLTGDFKDSEYIKREECVSVLFNSDVLFRRIRARAVVLEGFKSGYPKDSHIIYVYVRYAASVPRAFTHFDISL